MAAWHATYHAAHVFGQQHPSPWMLEEMRAEFLGERAGERVEPFGGYVDGACVATGTLELPQMDNLHIGQVDVAVHPDHRRRGHGSAMLAHLTDRAVARAGTP
jgi:ribosomal protein S18 acetylase RimI-like enzyme